MNVYDFDKTIYQGDCTLDFWRYCIKKHPRSLKALPPAALFGLFFKLKLCTKEVFKEKFYAFLQYVPDIHYDINDFWDKSIRNIKKFYLRQCRPDDLVISASPEFLIGEACRRMNINCIASKVNPLTGKLEGPNCYGAEKVRQFRTSYPDVQIEEFYSDSLSDILMAREAKTAFLVENNAVREWRT